MNPNPDITYKLYADKDTITNKLMCHSERFSIPRRLNLKEKFFDEIDIKKIDTQKLKKLQEDYRLTKEEVNLIEIKLILQNYSDITNNKPYSSDYLNALADKFRSLNQNIDPAFEDFKAQTALQLKTKIKEFNENIQKIPKISDTSTKQDKNIKFLINFYEEISKNPITDSKTNTDPILTSRKNSENNILPADVRGNINPILTPRGNGSDTHLPADARERKIPATSFTRASARASTRALSNFRLGS